MDDAGFPYHATKTGFNVRKNLQLGADTTVRRDTSSIMAQDKSNHEKAGTSFKKIRAGDALVAPPAAAAVAAVAAASAPAAAPRSVVRRLNAPVRDAAALPPLPAHLASPSAPFFGALELVMIFGGVFGLLHWLVARWRPKLTLALTGAMAATLLVQMMYSMALGL